MRVAVGSRGPSLGTATRLEALSARGRDSGAVATASGAAPRRSPHTASVGRGRGLRSSLALARSTRISRLAWRRARPVCRRPRPTPSALRGRSRVNGTTA